MQHGGDWGRGGGRRKDGGEGGESKERGARGGGRAGRAGTTANASGRPGGGRAKQNGRGHRGKEESNRRGGRGRSEGDHRQGCGAGGSTKHRGAGGWAREHAPATTKGPGVTRTTQPHPRAPHSAVPAERVNEASLSHSYRARPQGVLRASLQNQSRPPSWLGRGADDSAWDPRRGGESRRAPRHCGCGRHRSPARRETALLSVKAGSVTVAAAGAARHAHLAPPCSWQATPARAAMFLGRVQSVTNLVMGGDLVPVDAKSCPSCIRPTPVLYNSRIERGCQAAFS